MRNTCKMNFSKHKRGWQRINKLNEEIAVWNCVGQICNMQEQDGKGDKIRDLSSFTGMEQAEGDHLYAVFT